MRVSGAGGNPADAPLGTHLATTEFVVGAQHGIADADPFVHARRGGELTKPTAAYPNLARWLGEVAATPAWSGR